MRELELKEIQFVAAGTNSSAANCNPGTEGVVGATVGGAAGGAAGGAVAGGLVGAFVGAVIGAVSGAIAATVTDGMKIKKCLAKQKKK